MKKKEKVESVESEEYSPRPELPQPVSEEAIRQEVKSRAKKYRRRPGEPQIVLSLITNYSAPSVNIPR